MTTPNLRLISFTLCPFVQRAVVVLREHARPFDVEYISLREKPEWFLKLSPRGRVPILVLDDGLVLFESHAICEYLDETTSGARLMPRDPVHRARDRAWIAFAGDELFAPLYRFETAKDAAAFDDARATITRALARLDEAMGSRAFLSGDGATFGMADACFAPALFRFDHTRRTYGVDVLEDFPRLAAWCARVVAKESVQRSVPASWHDDHAEAVRFSASHLGTRKPA